MIKFVSVLTAAVGTAFAAEPTGTVWPYVWYPQPVYQAPVAVAPVLGPLAQNPYLPVPPTTLPPAQPVAPPAPVASAPQPAVKEEVKEADDDSKYITIKSPIIGTFYRKPSPDKPAFVEVGDTIGKGDVLCVIEAMKLFNDIESEVSGKIVKVLVEDSSPVEFDQPLFLIDPS